MLPPHPAKCVRINGASQVVQSVVKNLLANTENIGDAGSIPGLGRPSGDGNDNPLQLFLPGKSHGQRSLEGYSPWGCKQSDMTERLTTTTDSKHK